MSGVRFLGLNAASFFLLQCEMSRDRMYIVRVMNVPRWLWARGGLGLPEPLTGVGERLDWERIRMKEAKRGERKEKKKKKGSTLYCEAEGA